MAGKQQPGNQFFRFDVDFFSDKKVKILKARYGSDGVTLYLYLLCEIYKNVYYLKVDDDFEYIISDDLGMSPDKVKQVLAFLLSRSLLESTLFQSDAVLTSAGIQRRYQQMVKSRAIKTPIKIESFWLLSEDETESFIKVRQFSNNSKKNDDVSRTDDDDSEKKPIKEKENKYIYLYRQNEVFSDDEELRNLFESYLSSRREKGEVLSDTQVRYLMDKIVQLTDVRAERIEIIKEAIRAGWKNFYPLKQEKQQDKKPAVKKNRFNNFNQRQNNISSIEEALMRKRMRGNG